ncbi:MAG: ester cyclase, partial [Dehalococcoidia bacterium]
IEDYGAALNAHDVERIASLFTDDGIFEDVPMGIVHHGKEGVKANFSMEFTAFSDYKVEMKTIIVAGEYAATEAVMTATHTGDFPMLPATGKSVSVRAASIFEMRGDKIKRNTNYFNMALMMQQLGVMPSG